MLMAVEGGVLVDQRGRSEPPEARPSLVVAVIATLALAAALLAVPSEHGQRLAPLDHHHPVQRAGAAPARPDFDPTDAIDQVRHRVTAAPGQPGTLAVSDGVHRATFDAHGFAVDRLGFHLSSIGRGRPAAVEASAWTGRGNVADRTVGRGLTERVTAHDGSLEWDVVVADRPAGVGDLVVTAALVGLRGAATTEAGHVMLDGLSVGELVVKDRAGSVLYRAMPVVDGKDLRLVVPGRVLDHAQYPLTLDPTVGAEAAISGIRSQFDDADAAVSFDGTNFIVVWDEYRGSTNKYDVLAARFTPAGVALDASPIVVSATAAGELSPSVAFNGVNYLVVWHDFPNSIDDDIRAARVAPSGAVLDTPITISAATGDQTDPSVTATTSNQWYVVWQDARNGTGSLSIYGTAVQANGTVSSPNSVRASAVDAGAVAPSVAFDGTNLLVVWELQMPSSQYAVRARRINPSGGVFGSGPTTISPAGRNQRPAVAFGAGNYFVTWTRYTGTFGGDPTHIYGTRVDTSLNVLDPAGIPIATASAEADYSAVTFDGTNYVAAWTSGPDADQRDVFATRIGTNGSVTNPNGVLVSGPGDPYVVDPAIGAGGGTNFVAWQEGDHATGERILGARLGVNGALPDAKGLLVSTGPAQQFQPDLAFDGTNYLVVWADGGAGFEDIRGTRVTPAGVVLDPGGIAIAVTPGRQFSAHVAFDGTNFLVVWTDGRSSRLDIFGDRVTKAGVVLDSTGFNITPTAPGDQFFPDVTFDGSRYLVAWTDQRTASDIYAARVATNGTVTDPSGIPVSTGGGGTASETGSLSVEHASGSSLVAWTDFRSGHDDVYGARISQAGVVANPGGSLISTNAAGSDQDDPTIATNGADYFVVWDDARNGSALDIYGTRLSSSGAVGDPTGIPISTATGTQTSPTVARNGSEYLVAWDDNRFGDHDIIAQRVLTDGTLKDADFFIAPSFSDENSPTLTGQWQVVYSRVNPGGHGIFTRAISPK